MGLEELDLLLNKEAIIYTYSAKEVRDQPDEVERVYAKYARTHVALGDTTKYVDIMRQYVSGTFKKAFVGGVNGDYGHGKTSFLVHTWHECVRQGILCVPPFKMNRMSECVETVAEWVAYSLQNGHKELSEKARALGREYRALTLEGLAHKTSEQEGTDYEQELARLKRMAKMPGVTLDLDRPPSDFLSFLDKLSGVAQEAGWKGLLVLLDEAENAANIAGMTIAAVYNLIFAWADGMVERQGNYGLFISMPESFLSKMMNQFPAAGARLEQCRCLVSLRDLYGSSFARDLWERFSKEFKLGKTAAQVVSEPALDAIGQVGCSERRDLSFGPRTVVSAFKRMVGCFQETKNPYEPADFVQDCLDQLILVQPEYRTRVKHALEAPQAHELGRETVLTLAAFPTGLPDETAAAMGMKDVVKSLARLRGYARSVGRTTILDALMQIGSAELQDELGDLLRDSLDTYSPSPTAFGAAQKAFIRNLLPWFFVEGKGKSLLGWNVPTADEWRPLEETTLVAEYDGSFAQTEKTFPMRTVLVTVGDPTDNTDVTYSKAAGIRNTKSVPDLVVQFCLRWNPGSPVFTRKVLVDVGENTAKRRKAARITLFLDLTQVDASASVASTYADVVDLFRTGLGALYAIGVVDNTALQRDATAAWAPIKDQTMRQLVQHLMGSPQLLSEAEELSNQKLPGDAVALLGSLARFVLLERYPVYHTLIRQPEWEKRIGDYINALQNINVPLTAKRGAEPWIESSSVVAATFRTGPMALYDYFDGFEDLLEITEPAAKGKPVAVSFHIHPHEKAVMDIIGSSAEPKREIDGKLCCWIRYADVMVDLIYAGYCEREVKLLISIGKSRATFESEVIDGESILYCRPLDARQRAALCNELLDDFRTLQEAFVKLPTPPRSLDIDAIGKEILFAKTEGNFDAIERTLKAAKQNLELSVPGQFEAFQLRLNAVASQYDGLRQEMAMNALIHQVTTTNKGASKWVSALNSGASFALEAEIKKLKSQSDRLSVSLGKLRAVDLGAATEGLAEKIGRLLQADVQLEAFRTDCRALSAGWTKMVEYLKDYDAWLKLLTKSDALLGQLIEMEKDPNHKEKGADLHAELEQVSTDIATHLHSLSIVGLGEHGQYELSMDEIDKKRHEYLLHLRQTFEEAKTKLNEFICSLASGDSLRVQETFDPDDISGSYAHLRGQALSSAETAIKSELQELKYNSQELSYARDVLSIAPPDEARRLMKAAGTFISSLVTLLSAISESWMSTMVKNAESAPQVVKLVDDARHTNRDMRKAVDGWVSSLDKPEPSTRAREMLRLLGSQGGLNLKQLVLESMSAGADSKDALEQTLKALSELFRQLRVEVVVKATGSTEPAGRDAKRAK